MAVNTQVVWSSLSKAELDYLYSSSCWSEKLGDDVIVDNHITEIEHATRKAKCEVKHTLDVHYGTSGSSSDTLDLYYPGVDDPDINSVFVFLHGGCWCALDKSQYGYVCQPLCKLGITVAVVNYDLAPKGSMTTIVAQCRRACAHIVKTFPDKRLFVSGHSAGAHLCACLLSTNWAEFGVDQPIKFSGAILISGLFDLEPVRRCYMNDALKLTEFEVTEYSAQRTLSHVRDNLLPNFSCLLAYGSQESPEFKRHSQEYHKALLDAGVNSRVCEIAGEDHFTMMARVAEDDYALTKMITQLITMDT